MANPKAHSVLYRALFALVLGALTLYNRGHPYKWVGGTGRVTFRSGFPRFTPSNQPRGRPRPSPRPYRRPCSDTQGPSDPSSPGNNATDGPPSNKGQEGGAGKGDGDIGDRWSDVMVKARDATEFARSFGMDLVTDPGGRVVLGLMLICGYLYIPGVVPDTGGSGGGSVFAGGASRGQGGTPGPLAGFGNVTLRDPEQEGMSERVLAAWFGVPTMHDQTLLSNPAYIVEWKLRFKRLLNNPNATQALLKAMYEYKLVVDRATKGSLKGPEWESKDGYLAQLLLIDQFARGCGYMPLANQKRAERLALAILNSNANLGYLDAHAVFMPLLRSEDSELQRKAANALDKLSHNLREYDFHFDAMSDFATDNANAIDKFGRLPNLNEVLGRNNTIEEVDYLLKIEAKAEVKEEEEHRKMWKMAQEARQKMLENRQQLAQDKSVKSNAQSPNQTPQKTRNASPLNVYPLPVKPYEEMTPEEKNEEMDRIRERIANLEPNQPVFRNKEEAMFYSGWNRVDKSQLLD